MKITIKDTLVNGTRTVFHNSKIVVLLWGINAASALLLSIPIYSILLDNLNRSMMSDKLAVQFDYTWFLQLQNLYSSNISETPFMIYGMVGIYALIQTFFLGGLISVFNTPKKNHMVDFFYGCVKYWFRFTKIMLVTILLFAIAFELNSFLGTQILSLFKKSENVMAEFVMMSLRYILLIFMIGVVTIISDYSKVNVVILDTNKIFKSILSSMKFIRDNFNKVFTVFLLVAVIGALGAIVYNIIGKEIPRTPFYFLIVSFLLQQMLIIFRLFVRMLFYSTEVILYKDLNAEVVLPNLNESN